MTTPTLLQAAQDVVDYWETHGPVHSSLIRELHKAIGREKATQQPERGCVTCAYSLRDLRKVPCHSCLRDDWSNWEQKP